jgi:tRNA-2-methylthio-N6-dimethylallyladenosine synthase
MAKRGKEMTIGVAGCVAQAEGEQIVKRAPFVDLVIGSHAYPELPAMLSELEATRTPVVSLEFPEEQKFDALPEESQPQGASAFVSVQEGCDKFCTFCVVPYTRGAEYSRNVQPLLDEVKRRVDQGTFEITLLGQNVNAYHGVGPDGSEWNLARLMRAVAEIDGVKRLRYTTSHPCDMDDDLIAAHGEIPELMPYLHLPVQAGSNRILKAMNRKHTAEDYIAIIEKLRAVRPDIAFSGDFIVGFPGETEKDFDDTLALVETVGYASAYSFKYSQRPGTPGAEMDAQVPEEDKKRRLAALQNMLNRQQAAFNQSKLGQTMPVLLDRLGKLQGQMQGRSPYMQSVYVEDAVDDAHALVDVRIIGAYANSLKGEIVRGNHAEHPEGMMHGEIREAQRA